MSIKLLWPFDTPILPVTGNFGRLGPYDYFINYKGQKIPLPHTGTDYPPKLKIKTFAPEAGKVIEVYSPVTTAKDYKTGYGRFCRIKLNNGYRIGFAHMDSLIIKSGQVVTKGQLIGYTGQTGTVTGPVCHIEFADPAGRLIDLTKVVQWSKGVNNVDLELERLAALFTVLLGKKPNKYDIESWRKSKLSAGAYATKHYLIKWVKKSQYDKEIATLNAGIVTLQGQIEKLQKTIEDQNAVNDTLITQIEEYKKDAVDKKKTETDRRRDWATVRLAEIATCN